MIYYSLSFTLPACIRKAANSSKTTATFCKQLNYMKQEDFLLIKTLNELTVKLQTTLRKNLVTYQIIQKRIISNKHAQIKNVFSASNAETIDAQNN